MYKIKRLTSIFLMMAGFLGYSQVGINTSTPKAGLDVQGTLGIRKNIYLGGNDATNGALGQKGTVLVSQGSGLPPVWKVLRVPPFDPFLFYSFNNFGTETQNGLVIGNTTSGSSIYTDGQTLTSSWSVINDLTKTINIYNTGSIVVFSFETLLHLGATSRSAADVACGIFVDDQLKGVRVYTLNYISSNYPFYTFNLITAAKNLSIGPHTVKVACTRRANINNFTGNIGIGKPAFTGTGTNVNDFMTQSTLTIESFEKPNPNSTTPIYVP